MTCHWSREDATCFSRVTTRRSHNEGLDLPIHEHFPPISALRELLPGVLNNQVLTPRTEILRNLFALPNRAALNGES
jgi:hypothetical protein